MVFSGNIFFAMLSLNDHMGSALIPILCQEYVQACERCESEGTMESAIVSFSDEIKYGDGKDENVFVAGKKDKVCRGLTDRFNLFETVYKYFYSYRIKIDQHKEYF